MGSAQQARIERAKRFARDWSLKIVKHVEEETGARVIFLDCEQAVREVLELALPSLMVEIERRRDVRQERTLAWVQAAFGVDTVEQRGLRMLEEAIELYQAAGCDQAQAHALIDYVFSRPVGQVAQELGGLGVTLLALAATAGLSADQEEQREVERVLSKPLEHFKARNAAKNAAGFAARGPA